MFLSSGETDSHRSFVLGSIFLKMEWPLHRSSSNGSHSHGQQDNGYGRVETKHHAPPPPICRGSPHPSKHRGPLTPPGSPSFRSGLKHPAKDDFEVLLPTKLEEIGSSSFKRMNSLKQKEKIKNCLDKHADIGRKKSAADGSHRTSDEDWTSNISHRYDSHDNDYCSCRHISSDPVSEALNMWKIEQQEDYDSSNLSQHENASYRRSTPSPVRIVVETDQGSEEIKDYDDNIDQRQHPRAKTSMSVQHPSKQWNHVERSKSTSHSPSLRDLDFPDYPSLKKNFVGNSYTNLLPAFEGKSFSAVEEEAKKEGRVVDFNDQLTERKKSLPNQSSSSRTPPTPKSKRIPSLRMPDVDDEREHSSREDEDDLLSSPEPDHVPPPPEHGILGHWYHNIFSHHKARKTSKKKAAMNEDIKFFFESAFSIKHGGAHSPTGAFHNIIFDPSVMEAFLNLPEIKEIKELWHFIEDSEKIKSVSI